MIQLLKKSLQHRLLAALLLVGIVPYFFIMLYFTYWGHESITQQQNDHYAQQVEQSKLLIEHHLQQLTHEVGFLSRLEIFDDMITSDLDHRISRLLEQKTDFNEEHPLELRSVNLKGDVLAASQVTMLNDSFDPSWLHTLKSHTIFENNLIIIRRLFSSFDKRELGYLVAHYPLENLKRFMINDVNSHSIIMSDHEILVGEKIAKAQKIHKVDLTGILDGFELVYTIDDNEILNFIRQFILYLTLLLLLGMGIIYYVSRRLASQIVRPISSLTQAAQSIITTQNYDLRVHSTTIDETGSLANMFNKLIERTQEAFEALSHENKIRMQRFIDLTDMFNHITQINDENACIKVSLEKLHAIIPLHIDFIHANHDHDVKGLHVKMYLTDFTTQKQELYGYLLINKDHFEDEIEARFFHSVASMIMLQIERIMLISKIESASEAKSAFISGMSHELRTPLNAIIGFSQYLITYESLSDEQLDTMGKIEKAAMHLLSMINEILDIAKIEAGKIELTCKDTEMNTLFLECLELLQPLADEKNIMLMYDNRLSNDFIMNTDAKLCKQILINLLSNAIKFTDNGSVSLHVREHSNQLIISIIDTGVGISKEDLECVFNEFTQLNNATTSKHKGTGLGLSLSRHIAHALGAQLSLTSDGLTKGSQADLIFNL